MFALLFVETAECVSPAVVGWHNARSILLWCRNWDLGCLQADQLLLMRGVCFHTPGQRTRASELKAKNSICLVQRAHRTCSEWVPPLTALAFRTDGRDHLTLCDFGHRSGGVTG